MEQPEICPWCHSEIVWDEELGAEEACPHCDNELKGYRTLSLHLEPDDESADNEPNGEYDGAGEISDEDHSGFRSASRTQLAFEEKVQRILELQEEMPECPFCREYMLESGRQTIVGIDDGYRSAKPGPLGEALLPAPYQTVWYVCPSCFQMQNRLSMQDRDGLIRRLSGGAG